MKALRFKHLFGETQREKWEQVTPSSITCDSTMIKANSRYTSFLWGSGGAGIVCIVDSSTPTKIPMGQPMLKGHQGSILDLDWYPFDDSFLATSSMDNSVKLWRVPEPFNQDLTEAETTLYGHDKKVNTIQWNPVTEFTLASGAFDSTLKVWDVQKGEAAFTVQSTAQAPVNLDWNYDGSILGSSWNDKKFRLTDPRTQKFSHEVDAHAGTKPQRFAFLGTTGYFLTCGFSKEHEREFYQWSLAKPDAPVDKVKIDAGSGVLFPTWDEGLGVLYIVGRGDSSIRYWEYQDGKLHYLNAFNSNAPGKGYSFFPKRSVDVLRCEVMRCAKLADKTVEYISIVAPRKSQNFQEDLFPEAPGADAALTFADWSSGKNSAPKLQSLKPENMPTQTKTGTTAKFEQKERPAGKQTSNEGDVNALKARISELEGEVAERDRKIEELETIVAALKVNQK